MNDESTSATLTWRPMQQHGLLYPYVAVASRSLSNGHMQTMIKWCQENYCAMGGVGASVGTTWYASWAQNQFKFKEETDRLMFILRFTGNLGDL
jgi:hypothetical protein